MPNTVAASSDHRTQVHTEVRAPGEAIATRVIWFIFAVVEVLLAIRFVLKLIGANSEAGFVQLINGVSGVFMAPFVAILGSQRVAGATFEWSALIAIAVYALIAWGLVSLIAAVSPRSQAETVQRVESDEDVVAK
jgi:hypothetical protein